MEPIIIDCDPGHDDAIAIMLAAAHSRQLKLLGITTIGGNQTLAKITDNALKLMTFLDLNVPLARGAEGPLVGRLVTGADAHGDSGMDGPVLPPSSFAPIEEHAVEFMARTIRASEERVTLIPLGPLTNIAMLLKAYPDVAANIRRISLMGGGLARGNVTATAEFNIYVDPEAAKIVFASGIPIVMSGLDVTEKAMMMDDEILALRQRGGQASRLVAELLEFYSIASKRFGFEGSALHDPCAVAYLLAPELFQAQSFYVDVETQGTLTRGMTVGDLRPRPEAAPNATVLMDVDRKAFISFVFDALSVLDDRLAAGGQS